MSKKVAMYKLQISSRKGRFCPVSPLAGQSCCLREVWLDYGYIKWKLFEHALWGIGDVNVIWKGQI